MRSSRSASGRRAQAFSLIEILLCLLIFGFALVAIVDLFSSSHRITHSATRVLEASIHGQALVDAICRLDPSEVPPAGGATEWIVLEGRDGSASGGAGRWSEIVEFYKKPVPFQMDRVVRARKLERHRVIITVEIEFQRVAQREETTYKVVLEGLSASRGWD